MVWQASQGFLEHLTIKKRKTSHGLNQFVAFHVPLCFHAEIEFGLLSGFQQFALQARLRQQGIQLIFECLDRGLGRAVNRERLALGLVFESIFGYTAGIRAVDTVSRADFGLLAGLPFLPSPSTQYRFLQAVPVKSGLDFQTALGRRLVALDQVTPGHPVNIDGHNIKTYSRQAMKHAFITQEARYGKAIRTFYTQDQFGGP